jgi:hypothetical protein
MTRAEQISEYANSFNGKGMESEELKEIIRLAIIDGAKWADNHPIKPSLPDNLDEACKKISEECYDGYFSGYEESHRIAARMGAEWMAGQGETHDSEIVLRITGSGWLPAVTCLVDTSYKEGDKVIVQIRKK